MDHSKINLSTGPPPMPMPENYDLMPLKKRFMLLFANRLISFEGNQIGLPIIAGGINGSSSQSQSGCSVEEKMMGTISTKEKGESVGCNKQGIQAPNLMVSSQTAPTSVGSSSLHQLLSPKHQKVHLEPEMSAEDVDHLPLTVRLRRLTRKTLGPVEVLQEENYSGISPSSATRHHQITGTGRELTFGDQRHSTDYNQNHKIHRNSESGSTKGFVNPASKTTRLSKTLCTEDSSRIERNDRMHSSKKNHYKGESNGRNTHLSPETRTVQYDAAQKWPNIKIEPENDNEIQNCNQLAPAPAVNIKVEPSSYGELQLPSATPVGQMSSLILPEPKTEFEIHGDFQDDKLDHLLLRERMRMLSPKNGSCFNVSQHLKCTDHVESSFSFKRPAATPAQSLKINRPRKRRKTVTDSIETAMEEDAPGLLKVLIDKGVSVNEIKLYGEPENNDALDNTQTEDCFAELEEVISKLFSRRESFLKFAPLRCTKVEKASYCLECLFSLVEQARYLQFRNWPVEWGWCRDLQSFIFVFERHNRIVLERPEYGYATYFFELAKSLPVSWQIKRLVIAMKLTNYSRITLIENKALKIGDDLSEGEASVLLQYGWTPDTGLGTMLNYYDRVVHDRKTQKDSSEWRSKIGKWLMDGYNGGTVVTSSIPSKVMEYNEAHPVPIKVEVQYN